MNQNLELFYFPSCPYCQFVLKAINELGLNISMRDIMKDKSALEFHVKKTGRRTVPCLYIDGEPLFESQDIVTWLKKNYRDLT